ncbi:MAG: hypothetical protein EPN55_04725 [Gammaproteobacteria bacterium]|nr:MAG: hypothetical protein EPN55_04725 [Gammaproteobacteria bacterium]
MNQIDPLLSATPAADGVRPEMPATGETGGNTAFTQLFHSAYSTTAPAPATDSPPPDAAALAELFRQSPVLDGKDLPPLTTEGLSAVTGADETDKLPDAAGTAAPTPVMAALLPPTPAIPPVPATPTDANVAATAAVPDAIDKAVKAAIESDTKQPLPAALPQSVDVKQQPASKFDAAAIDAAWQQLSGTNHQDATVPLPLPAAEQVAAVERLARTAASVDAPVSLQSPVEAVRQLTAGAPDVVSRTPAPTPVPVPPDHPQWGQAFGERVVWLVNQHTTSAQLSLNPPDLGRLDVQINLEQDRARLLFATPHESVREAIEAAVPRLREMLADAGVQLLDVGIERHAGGRQPHPFQAPTPSSGRGDSPVTPAVETPAARSGMAVGLVDYFI